MTGDAVLASQSIVRWLTRLHVMLSFVVQHEDGIAVVLVDFMRNRTER